MEIIILLSILVSILTTFFILPHWIKRAKKAGLVGKDMNKFKSQDIAEAGGIVVTAGFILGVLTYIAIRTFYFQSSSSLIEILALICTILIVSFIGMIDDVLEWKLGLNKKIRIFLVLFASIPLVVINAGESTILLPFLGVTNIEILYTIILIPLGIIGATTTFNFLAGYNGLEAGQGILILSALALASLVTGSSWLGLVALCMIGALFGFLYYNKYPARVFPGDVLTYSIGALIACMAILGNYEMFAIFIFTPYIIETCLKLRGKLNKESFGVPQKDGSIKNKYEKIYGLEHLAIRIIEKVKKSKKAYEWEVVLLIHAFQIIIILLGFILLLKY